jgi:hypothetical protein
MKIHSGNFVVEQIIQTLSPTMESLSINSAMLSTVSLSLAFILLGMAKTSNAQTFAEAEKDCKMLNDVYDRFYQDTYWVFSQSASGGLPEAIEVYLKVNNKVKTINEVSLKQAEKVMADFNKKYGKNGDNDQAFSEVLVEIRNNDKTLNKSGSPQSVPSTSYDQLKASIEEYKTKIAQTGDNLALSASYVLDMLEYRDNPQEVADMIMNMGTALNLAKQFNPQCKQANELLPKLDAIKKTKIKEIEESRKSARMPKNHTEFKGDAKAVVAKAVEFINSKNTNPKFTYFTGSIGSPWYERVDTFGNTIDYTIQVNIGYQTQGEPANVVHVYKALLYTCTKKPEASFCNKGVVMGWEFTMLKENLGK